jgi:hypothetical protein
MLWLPFQTLIGRWQFAPPTQVLGRVAAELIMLPYSRHVRGTDTLHNNHGATITSSEASHYLTRRPGRSFA